MKVLFVILIFYLFDVIEMSRYSYHKYIYEQQLCNLSECGRLFKSPETTIGGQKSNQAPWTVSIGYHDEKVKLELNPFESDIQSSRVHISINVLDVFSTIQQL